MRGAEPLITTGVLRGLSDRLATYPGIDFDLSDLLVQVGLPADLAKSAVSQFSLNRFADLLQLAAARTADECFAMHFAKAFPEGGIGVLGIILQNAPDLRTMVTCLARFTKLGTDALTISLDETDGQPKITWTIGPELTAPHQQLTEFLLVLFVDRVRKFMNFDWRPVKTEFSYPEPNSAGDYEAIFGLDLVFSAPLNRLTIQSASLKRTSENANAYHFKTLTDIAEKELATIAPSSDLRDYLGNYIVENIKLAGVDLEGGARSVKLSTRQLLAELQRRNTSFENEVGLVRKRLATRYLRDTDLSMTEIALLLGYSELSGFTRAAKNWFGRAPSEARLELRGASKAP